MKKIFFICALLMFSSSRLFSQVAINADGRAAEASAGLDISYTDKGFLLPRMTFDQRNAIQDPAEGLMVYCINCNYDTAGLISIFQGGRWRTLDLNCYVPNTPAPGTSGNHSPGATVTQIIWDWDSVPIARGYKWSDINNYDAAIDLGEKTDTTETDLHCWTTYSRYVWAYNDCGHSPVLILTASTLDEPLNSQPAEAIHYSTLTTIEWNWEPVTGATGYKWNIINDTAFATDLGTATTITEDNLDCDSVYIRYVWAYNLCGISASTELSGATTADPPAIPVPGIHEATPDQILWKWNPVTDATGYTWSINNVYGDADDIDLGADTSWTETGLACVTIYNRFVWAYNDCAVSSSSALTQTTSSDSHPVPTPATNIPLATQVTWKWHPLPDHPSHYKWSADNDFITATNMFGDTSKMEAGLICNTSYIRYVWAYDSCAVSTPITLTQTTSLDPPLAPAEADHNPSPTGIDWNWYSVTGAAGYTWSINNVYGDADDENIISGTSWTETGLNCNTEYTRYVWAYSSCGVSDSTILAATTTLDPPGAPTSGTHQASTQQIIWNWNPVSGADGYKWCTEDDYDNATDMGTSTTITENGLVCGTNYVRFVWSYNYCGVSGSTALEQATPANPPADPVTAAHTAAPTQIVWKWHKVTGATGYTWSVNNVYGDGDDISLNGGTDTSWAESGLACNTSFTRYVWSHNSCDHSLPVSLTQSTSLSPPNPPVAGTHVASLTQIIWNWNAVSGATGYTWSINNVYGDGDDVNITSGTSHTETGLTCNTPYTRHVWAYSNCGVSTSTSLTKSTLTNPPASPTSGTHVPSATQVVWNWNAVSGAMGYKWSKNNIQGDGDDIDMGTAISMTETELTCNTLYIRYVWAYGSCGISNSTSLTATTTTCSTCGTSITINHIAGSVAPVTKTVTYNIVTNIPGETTKCWISSNLGASNQATSKSDATEAAAGWYWQFNRMQGYKHDGTSRIPSTTWITTIDEYSQWIAANDPCALELGGGWRLPTSSEWTNVDAPPAPAVQWLNWNGPWNSALKMHAAGYLEASTGGLLLRGSYVGYWSSAQAGTEYSQSLFFFSASCGVSQYAKSTGFTVRCIKQ